MRKNLDLNEVVYNNWSNNIFELAKTGDKKRLMDSLGKYIPFKVKKKIKGSYEASFVVEQDGEVIRTYKVTIGKDHPVSVSTDFGKVKMHVQTIIFSEAAAGIGIANLEGGTGLYVLNTVARIVLEYSRKNKPKGFDFTASETGGGEGTTQSRRKAYRALAMMLGKEAGFVNLTKQQAMTTGHFYIMSKHLFERWQDAVNSANANRVS